MTHAPLRSLRATTALCAVLALGSTPAWAQDTAAAPDAVVAPASPSAAPQPAAPQPTIQLPSQAPAPAAPAASTASPQITIAPVADEPAPVRTTAERRPAARTVAASRSTAPAAPAPVAAPRAADPIVTPPVAPIPPAASVPLTQPAVSAPSPVADARAASDTPLGLSPGAWVAALIALFGAGGAAYFVMRSRRRRDVEVYDDAYATEPAEAYVEREPLTAGEPTGGLVPEAPLPAFAMVEDETESDYTREQIGTEELAPATARETLSSGAFAMPAGPVPRGEARDELLQQMIDARPDEANPFRSRKARLRRARLILQSLEQKQKDEATQPFDWRTYESPTSNPAPATPPLVTA